MRVKILNQVKGPYLPNVHTGLCSFGKTQTPCINKNLTMLGIKPSLPSASVDFIPAPLFADT